MLKLGWDLDPDRTMRRGDADNLSPGNAVPTDRTVQSLALHLGHLASPGFVCVALLVGRV